MSAYEKYIRTYIYTIFSCTCISRLLTRDIVCSDDREMNSCNCTCHVTLPALRMHTYVCIHEYIRKVYTNNIYVQVKAISLHACMCTYMYRCSTGTVFVQYLIAVSTALSNIPATVYRGRYQLQHPTSVVIQISGIH